MTGHLSRRQLLSGAGIVAATLALSMVGGSAVAKPRYAVNLSDAEWKKRLSPAAYNVLRQEATERAWTSPLLKERRRGIFACAGCGQPLFRSQAKYDSGTGWPSFKAPIGGAIGTSSDHKIGIQNTDGTWNALYPQPGILPTVGVGEAKALTVDPGLAWGQMAQPVATDAELRMLDADRARRAFDIEAAHAGAYGV